MKERLRRTHEGIIQRCLNPNNDRFKDYGGRGITICDEWLKFDNFELWSLSHGYDESLTIDRIDNEGNYEPSNCKFSTKKEQSRNTRRNRVYEINGVSKTLVEIAEELNMNYSSLRKRLVRGWTIEKAMSIQCGEFNGAR